MGSNFVRYVLKNFRRVHIIILDALTYAGRKENLRGISTTRYEFIKGNICDTRLMIKLMGRADFVINFAAETHVDRSIHLNTDPFIKTNIGGVSSLLKALKLSPNVEKMIQVSTDEVWGDLPYKSGRKFNERSPYKPNSPYAASKAAGDLLIRAYVKTHSLPVIVTHAVNNFGPYQYPEKMIPFFALRAVEDKPIPLYGNGLNVRDWLYVDDHSRALLTLLLKGKNGEEYAISRGREYTNIKIASKILEILKKPISLIRFTEDRPGHDRKYSVDSSKLRHLGWRPMDSIDTKLKPTLQWYKNQRGRMLGNLKVVGINSHIKS